MIANYHTHTPRCNHAEGAERSYVERALAGGLQELGFSDHTPYLFELPGYYSTFRIDLNYPRLSKARTYAWVLALKTPKGYCSFVRYNETFELEKRWSGYYWNLAINEYMDAVKNNFGEIPNGEYSFECYFDGRIYGSVPFKVFKLD